MINIAVKTVAVKLDVRIPEYDNKFQEMDNKLNSIISTLAQITAQENQEMADLTSVKDAVDRGTTVEESAITLIQGMAAQIEANKTDPVALQSLADSLNSESDKLAAAVAANTPAE